MLQCRIGKAGGKAIRDIGSKAGRIIGALIACAILAALAAPVAAAQTQYRFPRANVPHYTPQHGYRFGDPGYRGRYSRSTRAQQFDRVTAFVSDIEVGTDGRLVVHESIHVDVAGNHTIRHGIYRDLPAYDHDPHGDRARLRLEILSVKRDNRPEPYTFDMLSHAWRIRIGDAHELVPPGPHVYEITYRTNRRIGFFGDRDEIYWNVTGNGWQLRIEQAVVSVLFPQNARILRYAMYTGKAGSTDHHAVAETHGDRAITLRTTQRLLHEEGFTVGIAIAKGAVREPQGFEYVSEFVHDNKDVGVVLIGLVLLTAYYFIVWNLVGRDPDGGPVAPLFAPPDISPAGARYLMNMGYDRKAFAATLVSLAVKGVLKIEDDPGVFEHTFTLVRGPNSRRRDLPPSEAAVASTLFAESGELALISENQPIVARAIAVLKNALGYEFSSRYFVNNGLWFGGGVALVALSALAGAYFSDSFGDTIFVFQLCCAFGLAAGFTVIRAFQHWTAAFARHGSRLFELPRALLWTAASLPPIAGILFAMFFVSDAMSPLTVAALAAEGFVAFLFFELLKRPTDAGTELRTELKGFRMFLETAEKERLEWAQPVNVTPEMFEKYLPYAIALDCDTAWARRFAADVGIAATESVSYQPGWTTGRWAASDFGNFTASLSRGLGHAASSAAFGSALGSGGASGGGGSSGGGGGGGGGGGW